MSPINRPDDFFLPELLFFLFTPLVTFTFSFHLTSLQPSISILSGHLWVEVALVRSTHRTVSLYWDTPLASDSVNQIIFGVALPPLLSFRS